MASFFDEDEDDLSQPVAGQRQSGPSRHRESSISSSSVGGAGSRSFLSRLESTLSPSSGQFSLGELRDSSRGMEDYDDESSMDFDEDDEEVNDVKKMGVVWVRERGTVDIMPWEGELIDTLFDKLEQQQKMVDLLQADPNTTEEEHFKLVLVQTEMERVKFLIRSYVRTRLAKIEKYSQYITLNTEVQSRLSGAEVQHATRYTELLHTHFRHSVLDSLPDWLQKLDDSYGDGLSMITKPNKNVPVLIYCRKDCGEITLDDGELAALAKGSTHLVKYNLVERWISLGWAEVL